MKNLKFIAVFSCFGFLLSFFSGLASRGNNIGRMIFHAVIFAIVFAGLAVLINIIFCKFLGSEVDISYESNSGEGNGNPVSAPSSHAVDIMVQDEDLPQEENAPQFFVGSGHQMLSPDDVKDVAKETAATANTSVVSEKNVQASESDSVKSGAAANSNGSDGFVPVSLGENLSNITSVEAKTESEVTKAERKASETVSAPTSQDDDELDSLPDLEDLSVYQQSNSSVMDEDGIDESTDTSDMTPATSVSAEEVTSGQDVELMAKAISTLLKKE